CLTTTDFWEEVRPHARNPSREKRRVMCDPEAKNILIADEEADIRLLITALLGEEGNQIQAAANETETLERIQQPASEPIIFDFVDFSRA
ncbi:MAG: hypothetical protein ORO03_01305, partial [Alphaproteobacteria bacterium]|nr:hypothetical protein [Alphaproteobacteria bacterium]